MLTKNEITALNLSPTKKDFVQIWNELLEVAGKLSERWDPTSTNESDPGIVILKALTGIADKLNYNIDKNTLEAFMPTAAQEESMRKLCEMLGYNVKYYQSAVTDVVIKYYNAEPEEEEKEVMRNGLALPKFTVITNSDQDVSYFTLDDNIIISSNEPIRTIRCMEGQIVKCESLNANNVITANQISESNRFYLPEIQVAENGIFIYNVFNVEAIGGTGVIEDIPWEKVDNLNIQSRGSRVFKFGFDSYESRPYIEFPEDYSELFNDGIFIYYTRTNGANGNVSPRTLSQIELPTTEDWTKVSAESFSVENQFAANSGANVETIKQAYNNFKKTIGTFETLVTCRDYMNKIYLMADDYNKPYVSNVLVTDIRNDLNRAITICSCDDAGIFYKELPIMEVVEKELEGKNAEGEVVKVKVEDKVPAIDHFDLVLYPFKTYNQIKNYVNNIQELYDASFNYNNKNTAKIQAKLEEEDKVKTIAHKITAPRIGDIISINNYMRLSATIATNSKITVEEGKLVKDKIKIALANAFNMRELDFGEAIPFDSLVEVIENSDSRIRIVSLNEPALYTTFSCLAGYDINGAPIIKEFAVASADTLTEEIAEGTGRFDMSKDADGNFVGTFNSEEAKKIYNKLVVRNILAGRVPLFNYNNSFKASFYETPYQVTEDCTTSEVPEELLKPTSEDPITVYVDDGVTYTGIYIDETTINYTKTFDRTSFATDGETAVVAADGVISTIAGEKITEIKTNCEIKADGNGLIEDVTLADGEYIKFRAPNFITNKTYPAYVNYNLQLNKPLLSEPLPAKAISLFEILNSDIDTWNDNPNIKWQKVLNYFKNTKKKFSLTQKIKVKKSEDTTEDTIDEYIDGSITVDVENSSASDADYTAEDFLKKSGCIKLTNNKAKLEWSPAAGQTAPQGPVLNGVDITLSFDNGSPFINDTSVLSTIRNTVDKVLEEKEEQLPTDCAWTISFYFECVTFEPSTFTLWEDFIRNCAKALVSKQAYEFQVLDFVPVDENGTIIWRLLSGDYSIGKYVTEDLEKLLKLSSNYFGLLGDYPIRNAYIVENIGSDGEATLITNNEERMLEEGEYLYIEYTPSTTTAEGTTQELAAVTEIHGKGTIIRPSGFDSGLIDSDILTRQGTTPFKTVTFDEEGGPKQIAMHRFGANEQVEIRDFAEVILDKAKLNKQHDNTKIYIYKNFNNCPLDDTSKIGTTRTYTLKDNEYIYYTDYNQAEFAYFGSGTEVTLMGDIVLDKYEEIDLAVVLDNGVQEVPWKTITFSSDTDAIRFQEFQYKTLGPGDKLCKLKLIPNVEDMGNTNLTGIWKFCDDSDVEYLLAGEETPIKLDKIKVKNNRFNTDKPEKERERKGNGWEACSILELAVSGEDAQTIRNTEKISTSITLSSTSGRESSGSITLEIDDPTLSFKTNLACQLGSDHININNKALYNPNELTGFELKVFSADEPTIVETAKNKTVPFKSSITNLNKWPGKTEDIVKDYNDLWTRVDLEAIKADDIKQCDYALRLPINLIKDTYGIFCIYVNYTSYTGDQSDAPETWLEITPGITSSDIMHLNLSHADAEAQWETASADHNNDRLKLRPGINCIRVNKSGRLFIKASKSAHGVLLFDELRLVNYKTDNEQASIGLNLDPLGYFALSSENEKLSPEVAAVAHADLAQKTLEALDDIEKTTNDSYIAIRDALKTKVPRLVEIEKNIHDELDALINTYHDKDSDTNKELNKKLAELFSKYYQIQEAIAQEKALEAALADNANSEETEQQLVKLLSSFDAIENEQNQLLNELEKLKASAPVKADTFSSTKLLNSFTSFAKSHADQINIDEIRSICKDKIEKHFSAQLSLLAQDITTIVNSEDRNNLMAALESMLVIAGEADKDTLEMQVSQLVAALDRSAVEGVISAAYDATLQGDYHTVAANLTQLREMLMAKDLQTLAAKIEKATEDGDKLYLKKLIEELNTLINATSTDLVALVSTIDKQIEYVQGLVISETTTIDEEVLVFLSDCREAVVGYYDTKLTELLSKITDTLDEALAETYNEAIQNLQRSKDLQVQLYTAKLTKLVTELNDKLKAVDPDPDEPTTKPGLTITTYTGIDFGEEAVCDYWIAYLQAIAQETVDMLYQFINESILDLSVTSTLEDKLDKLPEVLKSDMVFKQIICYDAFDSLLERTTALADKNSQNKASKIFIEEIEDNTTLPAAVRDAMGKLSENDRRAIIMGLIKKLTAVDDEGHTTLTVTEKQQTLKALKTELEASIEINLSLQAALANLLCPSLLLPDEALREDTFYSTLFEAIDYQNIQIKNSYTSNNLAAKIYGILSAARTVFVDAGSTDSILSSALTADNTNDIKEWLVKYANESLLPATADDFDRDGLSDDLTTLTEIKALRDNIVKDNNNSCINIGDVVVTNQELLDLISAVKDKVTDIEESTSNLSESAKKLYSLTMLEQQLLADIRKADVNNDFYYNVPVELSVAIDFNEDDSKKNTLLNPQTNYDINNVNNNFVISKLDINYLDKGLQIARSSRLS